MESQIADPDHQHRHVDWENPEHQTEYRMGVVVEVEVGVGFLDKRVSRFQPTAEFVERTVSRAM